MKKILITWYGITDLRASLGLESSDGPILSIIKDGNYTDAVILGYVDKNKKELFDFEANLQSAKDSLRRNDTKSVNSFIGKYSNTNIAYNNFKSWLLQNSSNKNIDFSFNLVELSHLNDTDGIYSVVSKVMYAVDKLKTSKEVHLFLSPGTPVMAFVWALISIRHPNIPIKLLASSIIGEKAEFVNLPKEWVQWRREDDFDIIFNLFGEQKMPSYLSTIQFKCKKHVFISSPKYSADVMRKFLTNSSYDEIVTNPYDPSDVKNKIIQYIKKLEPYSKIGFNLTGGTKLMYAGALAACKENDAIPFYFNSQDNSVMFLNTFEKLRTRDVTSIETFFTLNSSDLIIKKQNKDIIDDAIYKREVLTRKIFAIKNKLAKRYTKIISDIKREISFEFYIDDVYVKYDFNNKYAYIDYNGERYTSNLNTFEAYITGGWFEEYIYLLLKPLERNGIIFDLRINIELMLGGENTSLSNISSLKNDIYQELDIVFTDGKKLYIIECKSGSIKSEYIEKLKNLTLYYGGIESAGILAGCFNITNKTIYKKINDSKNIYFICRDYIRQIRELLA